MTQLYAYARLTSSTRTRRMHRLPGGSTPRVLDGQIVKASDSLAVLQTAREHRIVNLADLLGVEPASLDGLLLKHPGDRVEEGEPLARKPGFLGIGGREVSAPVAGRVLYVEEGRMLLEGERVHIAVPATAPGRVVAIEPEVQITVETIGAAVQLAWGQGGLSWGPLKVMDEQPSMDTDFGRFTIDHRGAIVVIGSPLTGAFLRGAADIRVRGCIASSVPAGLLPALEDVEFPVAVTQGFGRMPMSREVLSLLRAHDGREAVLDSGDGADSRERRPEIIIPSGVYQQSSARSERAALEPLAVGHKVRVLQVPYFGRIGTIMGMPGEPRRLASGLWAQGAVVQVEGVEPGKGVFVPFANLEKLA